MGRGASRCGLHTITLIINLTDLSIILRSVSLITDSRASARLERGNHAGAHIVSLQERYYTEASGQW